MWTLNGPKVTPERAVDQEGGYPASIRWRAAGGPASARSDAARWPLLCPLLIFFMVSVFNYIGKRLGAAVAGGRSGSAVDTDSVP